MGEDGATLDVGPAAPALRPMPSPKEVQLMPYPFRGNGCSLRGLVLTPRSCFWVIVIASIMSGPGEAAGQGLLIEDVTLIDGTGRPPMVGAYVLVEGDRIRTISRVSNYFRRIEIRRRWCRVYLKFVFQPPRLHS